MDITILSQAIISFLAPFLPYLVKVGEKASEEIGKKFGVASWDQAKALWRKLHPKLNIRPAAQEAVRDLVEIPEDPDRQVALRVQLQKLFKENPSFAEELSHLMGPHFHSEVNVGNVRSEAEVTGIETQTVSGNAEFTSRVTSKDVEAGKVTGISIKEVKR
jgi:hypothetical protein